MGDLIVAGIDYSMASPAICIHRGDEWNFTNCVFHYVSGRKKYMVRDKYFKGYEHTDWLTQEERFNNLASWAVYVIPDDTDVFLEGYSFSSKGVVFDIGENTGILKNKLWQRCPAKKFGTIIAPSAIKKFATGKGNADKLLMHQAFVSDTSVHIDAHFGLSAGNSPISDIVDSYFIAKYGFTTLKPVKKPVNRG